MSKKARAFKTTVGISLQQFDFLIRDVEKAYPQAESERLARSDRKRQVGAGRRFSLHVWDRVLLTLMYYRTYLTQDGMTHLFGITRGSISTNIGKMFTIIRDSLPLPQKLHKQACEATAVEDLRELFSGMVALLDASEQPVLRPQQPEAEKDLFPGKARMQAVKVQYTTSFDGLITHKTVHFPGRYHDFKAYKMKHPTFPTRLPSRDGDVGDKSGRDHLRHYGDTAYRRMANVVEGIDARIPVVRKPGEDLTPDQREYNGSTLKNPHTRREPNPEDQDLPDCQGKIQERPEKTRPHYPRCSLRGGQSDHPVEESRDPLRRAAAGRPSAGAARFLITDQVSGFTGRHASPKAIMMALMLFTMGMSPEGITLALKQQMGLKVHRVSVQRWSDRYVRLLERYAGVLRPSTDGIWICGERPARVKGVDHQVFTVMDAASRFILAWDISPRKLAYDTVSLFSHARDRAGASRAYSRPTDYIRSGPPSRRPSGVAGVPSLSTSGRAISATGSAPTTASSGSTGCWASFRRGRAS